MDEVGIDRQTRDQPGGREAVELAEVSHRHADAMDPSPVPQSFEPSRAGWSRRHDCLHDLHLVECLRQLEGVVLHSSQ
jgi:hypothetical protein